MAGCGCWDGGRWQRPSWARGALLCRLNLAGLKYERAEHIASAHVTYEALRKEAW